MSEPTGGSLPPRKFKIKVKAEFKQEEDNVSQQQQQQQQQQQRPKRERKITATEDFVNLADSDDPEFEDEAGGGSKVPAGRSKVGGAATTSTGQQQLKGKRQRSVSVDPGQFDGGNTAGVFGAEEDPDDPDELEEWDDEDEYYDNRGRPKKPRRAKGAGAGGSCARGGQVGVLDPHERFFYKC